MWLLEVKSLKLKLNGILKSKQVERLQPQVPPATARRRLWPSGQDWDAICKLPANTMSAQDEEKF
jgi:hypothetical protein